MILLLLNAILALFAYVPGGGASRIRPYLWRACGARIGRGATIDVGVQCDDFRRLTVGHFSRLDKYVTIVTTGSHRDKPSPTGCLTIGSGCDVGPHVFIDARGGVVIGDDVGIGAGVRIVSVGTAPRGSSGHAASGVVIDRGAVLGLNSVVLPATHVHAHACVGACSVVSLDVPRNVIAAGQPAAVCLTITLDT